MDLALCHLVVGAAGEHPGQGALARAVGPHDGVDLARIHRQVNAAEDLVVVNFRVQVLDFEHGIQSQSLVTWFGGTE